MLVVAQMLVLLFILAIVYLLIRSMPNPIKVGVSAYFIISIIAFAWLFLNTDNVELTRVLSGLIIAGLIIVAVYRLFLFFGHLENWQKIILIFASLVNGIILFLIMQMLFNVIFIELGA